MNLTLFGADQKDVGVGLFEIDTSAAGHVKDGRLGLDGILIQWAGASVESQLDNIRVVQFRLEQRPLRHAAVRRNGDEIWIFVQVILLPTDLMF